MTRRIPLWLTLAAGLAALSLAGDVAEAKKPRRGRKPHRFVSAPAPSKGRTPETNSAGAPAGASRDVAGTALDGPSRQTTLEGGTAIVLSPTRALVANPWRGLAVVDVTDPADPKLLGSAMLEGSADRVFVSGATALVVSRTWDEAGGGTRVTAVDLTDETAPAVTGVVKVGGDLVAVEQSGGELVVVTSSFGYGVWPYAGGGFAEPAGVPSGGTADGSNTLRSGTNTAEDGAIAPDIWYPGAGESKSRIARIALGAGGAPELVGELALDGILLQQSIDADLAVLVLDRTTYGWPGPIATLDGSGDPATGMTDTPGAPATGGDLFAPSGIDLVAVDVSGAPATLGTTTLTGLYGVTQCDLAAGVARIVGWGYDGGTTVATFKVGDGAPAAQGSVTLPRWPEASAFVGDRFVWSATDWSSYGYEQDPPPEPLGPGDDGNSVYRPAKTGTYAGPTTTLHVVDLSDPSQPTLGGSLAAGGGYTSGLQPAGDDVLATVTEWNDAGVSTRLLRVDLADATKPAVAASGDLDGSWYGTVRAGDLVLLMGGLTDDQGGWKPRVAPVSVEGDGLTIGAPFDAGSWIAAAAWSAPLLAVGSTDAVRFFDLSDLANPEAKGSVRLAVNVADLAVIDDQTAACLVTDWVSGAIEVRTVGLPEADALRPLDTVSLGTGDARLFRDGSMLYVLSTDWSTGRGGLTVVDATDPADLRVRGSLDLASYPGQAFLVNGSLVLLREAWSLVATNETTGKRKMLADPFGRCRAGWLRDELSAVLDVVDLSDPDAPRAAVRKRLRWDFGGEAVLRGSSLYVPSYVTYGWSDEGWQRTAYAVRRIDLTKPTKPDIGPLVYVPGSLSAAADDQGRVLTVSYDWNPGDWSFSATLHLVDLNVTDWRSRVLAEHRIDGAPGAVVAGDTHAYLASERWDAGTGASEFSLEALALEDLAVASSQSRERSAWGGTISAGHLFLRSWGWTGALDAYSLGDPASPGFVVSAPVDGVGTTVGVAGGRAYLPAGWRGVASFDLSK
jgi:hypothetical protein